MNKRLLCILSQIKSMDLLQTIFPIVLLGLIAAMLLAIVFAKVAIRIAKHFGILDLPNSSSHKKHEFPTPLAGGLTIAPTFLILIILFPTYFSNQTLAILLASSIILVFGLVDDVFGLDAKWKFLGQILASVVVIQLGVQVLALDWFSPEINYILNIGITLLWLVGLTNAFNLIDSADGLSLSLSGVTCILLIFASFISMQGDLVFAAGCLLGAILGLLYYNLTPAYLFAGDSGVQAIGFFLGALGILYNPAIQPQGSSWFVPITLVAIPIFDVGLVVYSRLIHRNPFFKADLNHTYHRLVAKGLSHQRAVWLMDMGAIFIGAIGLYALYQSPLVANLIFLGLIVVGVYLIIAFERI